MAPNHLLIAAQVFFVDAMALGWATRGDEALVPDILPGHKSFEYSEGRFRLIDRHSARPHSTRSSGSITIWCEGEVVWVMTYQGSYHGRVISFLQKALREAYSQRRRFIGGRGPSVFLGQGLAYTNRVEIPDFGYFKGREEIYDVGTKVSLGFHDYSGLSLIDW